MASGGDQSSVHDLSHAPKRARFAIEYARNGGNAYQAMLDAGYSESMAKAQQSLLLKDPRVLELIDRQRVAMCAVAGETRNTILKREIDWANSDLTKIFLNTPETVAEWHNAGLLHPSEWDEVSKRALKKVSFGQHGPTVEFQDAQRSNKNLADWTGVSAEESGMNVEELGNALAGFLSAATKTLSEDSGFDA